MSLMNKLQQAKWDECEGMKDDYDCGLCVCSVCIGMIPDPTPIWISIDDKKKPENRQVCLVVVNDHVDTAYFKSGSFWDVVEDRSNGPHISPLNVTHWMPRPEPPAHK